MSFFPDFSAKPSASVGILLVIKLHWLPADCPIVFNNALGHNPLQSLIQLNPGAFTGVVFKANEAFFLS